MVGVPTFVIGAGGVGIDVLQRLHDLEQSQKGSSRDQDQFAYLGIDSDQETLAQTPSEMPTIHLTGDSGVVGDGLERYPYLASDDIVPDDGTNQMRHIGRYKLDNTVSPGLTTHYHELRDRIGQFIETNRTSLDGQTDRCNIVVVGALGGGTGSGTLPLLAALLTHIGTHTLSDRLIRLAGIGIVPPLDIEPYYSTPPTDPVTYPNTYAAFRNLSTLLDASEEQPVAVPAYSLATDLDGTLDQCGDMSGIEFEFDTPAFDRYWLVSTAHGVETGSDSTSLMTDLASMVANALRTLSSKTPTGFDTGFWSRTRRIPPLGTMGYAAVVVPHQELEAYYEREQKRLEIEKQLKEMITPRIATLEDRQDTLTTTLETTFDGESDDGLEWVYRLVDRLDGETQIDSGLIDEFAPREITAALDRIADEESHRAGLLAARSLRWALGEGPIGSSMHSDVEQTYRKVRDEYAFQLVTSSNHRTRSLEGQLEALREALTGHIRDLRTQLQETEPAIQDLFPPTYELFTSDREHIQQLIEDLEADLDRVERAIDRLRALQMFRAWVENQIRIYQERIVERLATTESELDSLRRRRAECRDQVAALDQELTERRESLTDPDIEGPEFTLPLSWQALDEVSQETVESDLTSIAAYREEGMLAVDDDALKAYLERSYAYSRDWPDSIAQHAAGMTMSHTYDETMLRYHESNESEIKEFIDSLTGLDMLCTPANEEVAFTQDPYRIEMVSISQGGQPESLTGIQRLEEMADDGTLDAMAGSYRDFRRALAYPEWYDSSIQDAFR